jgi:hypothetical protein
LRGTSIIGGDIGAGILQRDEVATARQGDRIVERSFPAPDQPSRCGLIYGHAVEEHPDLAHETWRMIRRVMIAALVVAAPACPVSAQDTKVSVDMIGIGRMSCAHWRSTQAHRLEGTIWIYGFWTGLNYVAAASDQTQAKIDVAAIVAQVEKTCAEQTSQTLAMAAWTTYLESKR